MSDASKPIRHRDQVADRVVLTIAVGDNPLWTHTHPLMKEYADKVGADFLVLKRSDPQLRHPKLMKLAIHGLLDRYRRVLFLDGDVGVNPQCPNLFEMVPESVLGAVCERSPYYDRRATLRKACQHYGVEYSPHHTFFNSGVMVVSRHQRPMFAGDAQQMIEAIDGFLDQAYLNAMALKHGIPVGDLGVRFNYFGSLVHKANRPFGPEQSFLFHATGRCGDRLGYLQRTVEEWRRELPATADTLPRYQTQPAEDQVSQPKSIGEQAVWLGGFATCDCANRCGHTGMRSYMPHYQRVLDHVQPRLVYEWGPGMNSQMAIDAGAEVIAVEQNLRYVPTNLGPRFRALFVDVHAPAYPIPLVKNADLYFVDSRRRAECIAAIWRECVVTGIAPDTVVALHDAQRTRYHWALRLFPYVNFLDRGFCVASCRRDVLELPRASAERSFTSTDQAG